VAWSLILGGYAIALLEGVVMNIVFHSSIRAIDHHVYLGGICFSLGIFLLALAKPQLGQSTPFPYLGQLTLGIYVAHVFVMYTITPFVWKLADKVPMWGLCLGIIVYLASVIFVLVLARIPVIRSLVVKPAWERDQTVILERKSIDKAYETDMRR
jgi:surface polysaccharide O-acyltransferase-like enzyme